MAEQNEMYVLQNEDQESQGTVNIFTQDGQMVMEISGTQGDQSQFSEYGVDEVQAGEQMIHIANTFINAQEGDSHLLQIANTFADQGKNADPKKTDDIYEVEGSIIQTTGDDGQMQTLVFDENEHMYSIQNQGDQNTGEQSVFVQIPDIQNLSDQAFTSSGVQTMEGMEDSNHGQEIIIEGMSMQNLQNVRSEVLPDGTVQLYMVENEGDEDQQTKQEIQPAENEDIIIKEVQPSDISVVKETRYRDVATQITCYPKFSRQGLFDVATQVTKKDIIGGQMKNRQLPNGTTIIQNNIKTQNKNTVILNAGDGSLMLFYKCNICGKLYKNKPNWQNHIKSHAKEKVYMCGHCGKIFQKVSLASHLRTHSELAQIAVFENLPDDMKRKNHKAIPGLILSSEEASVIELDILDVPTEADESMIVEPEPEPEPPQPDLSEVFTDNDIPAKMHMEVEAETEVVQEGAKSKFVYKCNVCGKEYNSKSNCHRHLKSHTNEKEYKCGYCGKGFTHKYEVRMHCRIHTGEKPFKCPICTRGFNESGNLRRHMKIHVKDESPYKCGVCFKGFDNTARLNAHIKVHTGDIVCDICNRKFNKISDLYRHIRIHTGERPYKCDFCDKTFCQKVNLMTHKRTHTGLKAYRCDICGLGFSRKNIMDAHMASHDDPRVAKDRGTVERTPVKMDHPQSEELDILDISGNTPKRNMRNASKSKPATLTAENGEEIQIQEIMIQNSAPMEDIHVQEEACVTIG